MRLYVPQWGDSLKLQIIKILITSSDKGHLEFENFECMDSEKLNHSDITVLSAVALKMEKVVQMITEHRCSNILTIIVIMLE